MIFRRLTLALPALLTAAALTACAGTAAPATTSATSDGSGNGAESSGHGEMAGAAELNEPPLALMSIDSAGEVALLDLLTGESSPIGAVASPAALATDGRYGFVTTADGLEIVDSGRWSWDHGDHFHYYSAAPRIVGTVPGGGEAVATTGMLSTAGATGVFFGGTGEAVLLDNASLADGEITELFRIATGAETGVVAPLGDGALLADRDTLVFHHASGAATDATAACVGAAGAITTRVGLVVGCVDGAVLSTWEDSAPVFERIPYPVGADAVRATAFDGRKGRPTVAALAGDAGFWLLDTRELAWRLVPTDMPLARVSAVDDADGNVVALSADGRVLVYSAQSGEQLAATGPLVGDVGASASLTVDDQRAYVNDPATGVVFEIDYGDGARVARTLTTPTAAHFVAEVGR
ncbi:hypothetical protein JOD63_002471 [Microbacterium terrae]|uniref:ABC transporter n=1 Tax=Microbacterium terrae TaxID=69369 RepID=A0A0M2H9M7_9MICO|nr:hypothetical protein [Microbacterium terrae]KJL43292.1 hypothetical protein RS81_00897 [Microbacterium terrae]MBP1078503.1 hypothetical protein [Microbacterium terrae]GLJ97904.1 lipoprotein [Microbacterium terrae]